MRLRPRVIDNKAGACATLDLPRPPDWPTTVFAAPLDEAAHVCVLIHVSVL
jgi:hypothetical protein